MRASIEALSLTQDVNVQEDENIPTHSTVGIIHGRNSMRKRRTFAGALTFLKSLYDMKVAERCKAIEDEKCGRKNKHKQERVPRARTR